MYAGLLTVHLSECEIYWSFDHVSEYGQVSVNEYDIYCSFDRLLKCVVLT